MFRRNWLLKELGRQVLRLVLVASLVASGIIVLIPPMSAQAATRYESYNGSDDSYGDIAGYQWLGQSFTPSANHTLTEIKLKLYKAGTPPTYYYADIQSTNATGHPTGVALDTVQIYPNALTTSTSGAWYTYDFSTGVDVTANVTYAIVIRASGGGSPTNCVKWRADATAPTYSGGSGLWTTDNVTWHIDTNDYMFEEWEGDVPFTIETEAATNVGSTTFTANATISSLGTGGNATYRGFQTLTDTFDNPSLAITLPGSAGVFVKTGDDKAFYFYGDGSYSIYKKPYTYSTGVWGTSSLVYTDTTHTPINLGGGVIGDRVQIFMDLYTGGTDYGIGFVSSTDLSCSSWSGYTALPTTLSGFSPHGSIASTSDPDTYLQGFYEINAPQTEWKVSMYKTTDSGDNWTAGATIYDGAVHWCEPDIEYIGGGKMIAVIRNNSGGYVGQAMSSDDGDTWTTPTNSNLGDASGVKVVSIFYDEDTGNAIASFGDRNDTTFKWSETDADTVYADPTAWLPTHDIPSVGATQLNFNNIVKFTNDDYVAALDYIVGSAKIYEYHIPRTRVDSGSFGTGYYSSNLTGLEDNTQYYYRGLAYNTLGWEYGDVETFHTGASAPSLLTGEAISVTTSSATLQGTLTDIGGYSTVYAYFEYGTTTSYGSTTVEQTLTSAQSFNQAISGLTSNTVYHFRARVRYGTSSYVSGSDGYFTTGSTSAPGAPTNFRVSSYTANTTTLSWNKGSGADTTMIRWATTGYPTVPTEGTQLYNSTGTTTTQSDQTDGTRYYYSAWSVTGGTYSTTYVTATNVPTADTLPAPDIFEIETVQVYNNYINSGDQLLVFSAKIIWNEGMPTTYNPSDYFYIQVLDGATVVKQDRIKLWGYVPGSLYISSTVPLTWNYGYTFEIIGTSKFSTPPEATYTMTASNYIGNNYDYLSQWVIDLATRMEQSSYWSITFLDYSQVGNIMLTSQGAQVFNTAIPGLSSKCGNIFYPQVTEPDYVPSEEETDYAQQLLDRAEDSSGTALWSLYTEVGDFFDKEPEEGGMWMWLVLYVIILLGLVVVGVDFIPAVGISIPIVFGITQLGLIGMEIIVGIAIILLAIFLWQHIGSNASQ